MARVDISVPYDQKDVAKALGAKWDVAEKIWYIPDGIDTAPFKQWLMNPLASQANVRCNRFYVVEALQNCSRCSSPVKMVAFVMPRGWERWEFAEEEDQVDRWDMIEHDVMLNYITHLNEAALNAALAINKNYKLGLQNGHKSKKYVNYCEKCGASQEEPNSGNIHVFKPEVPKEAERLTLHYHSQPFESRSNFQATLVGHGGYNLFDYMKHGLRQG